MTLGKLSNFCVPISTKSLNNHFRVNSENKIFVTAPIAQEITSKSWFPFIIEQNTHTAKLNKGNAVS